MARRGRSITKKDDARTAVAAAPRESHKPAPAPLPPEPPVPPDPPAPPTPPPAVAEQPPLFECGWEVCWQLGGIYTVLKTKAQALCERWGDRYFLIGPYNPSTAAVEFEEMATDGFIRATLDRLRDQGIPCHFGRWLVPGRPRVILLDYRARYASLDTDKYLMWADHGISMPANDGEVNEVTAFGFTVAEFFRHLTDVLGGRRVVAQFHEWMAGVAVPRIAHLKIPVATVFTTHATLLGRYLAGDNPHFYDHLPFLNPDAEAQKYNIEARYRIEKAAAHASTVFTTVSAVTATEANKLLGRDPDVILPNGLNIHRFAALHEFQNLHRQYKEKIHEFVMGHFFPSYSFDLDRTIYLFISGRYEYRNKGMDLYIEALYRLNQRLRAEKDPPTVVGFIITRAPTRNINVGVLQNQQMYDDLRKTCQDLQEHMGRMLFDAAVAGRVPQATELIGDDAIVRLKRALHAWRRGGQPTVVTHDLWDDAKDPVLSHIRHRGLFNAPSDPVKVVFHPEFVTATSPTISLDYENFVRGCHMGIFPSYYEPWGYTPMESVALGVPAVTTDLSGFGAYVQDHVPEAHANGIFVLNRRTQGFEAACDALTEHLYNFVRLNRRQRIEMRNRVERLSELFDWSVLIFNYQYAYQTALERGAAYRPGKVDVRMV
jgi:glycogen(starch) synthase